MSLSGVIAARDDIDIDLADGPDAVLGTCVSRLKALATRSLDSLKAIAMSVPGPVNTSEGVIKMPARMPGWTEFAARDWLIRRTGVPAVVENDANMMAYAEAVVRQDGDAPTVTVKAGTSIGAGIIVNGALYRGATFAAGEITHYRVAAAGDTPCSCGNRGCLETIASGAALVAALRSQGVDVASTRDVVRLAHESNPAVTTAVRAAGSNLGQVLCAVVNFFNPRSIYLGGLLPTVEPFVAAVRAQIYQGSHPLLTEALTVERTRADADAILIGCGQRAIEESLGATISTQ
jgi:predicted NBD/HSP70 family sugar kinase